MNKVDWPLLLFPALLCFLAAAVVWIFERRSAPLRYDWLTRLTGLTVVTAILGFAVAAAFHDCKSNTELRDIRDACLIVLSVVQIGLSMFVVRRSGMPWTSSLAASGGVFITPLFFLVAVVSGAMGCVRYAPLS